MVRSSSLDTNKQFSSIRSIAVNADDVVVNKTLKVHGNIELKGDLINSGNNRGDLTIGGNLSVSRDSKFEEKLDVNKELNVSGLTKLNNGLTVDKEAKFKGRVNVDKEAKFKGDVNVDKELNVSGLTKLNNGLTVDKEAKFKGDVNVDKELNVSGLTKLNNGLTVDKEAKFKGDVNVDKELNVSEIATFNKNVNIRGNMTVDGELVFGTTTHINSTVTTILDPIIELGKVDDDNMSTVSDAHNRGIVLHYNKDGKKTGGITFDNDGGVWKDMSLYSETDIDGNGTTYANLKIKDLTANGSISTTGNVSIKGELKTSIIEEETADEGVLIKGDLTTGVISSTGNKQQLEICQLLI